MEAESYRERSNDGKINALNAGEYIKIPKSFGGSGPDDTFILCWMGLMRRSGKNVVQYLIENEVVVERPITNDAPKLIHSSNQQRNFATKNFHSELLKFIKKL